MLSPKEWPQERLQALYNRENRRFWRGALPSYEVRRATLPAGIIGYCWRSARTILLDLRKVRSTRELWATLAHEQTHVASNQGHGRLFWEAFLRLPTWVVCADFESTTRIIIQLPGQRRAAVRADLHARLRRQIKEFNCWRWHPEPRR